MKKQSEIPNETLKRWKNTSIKTKLTWLQDALEFCRTMNGKGVKIHPKKFKKCRF